MAKVKNAVSVETTITCSHTYITYLICLTSANAHHTFTFLTKRMRDAESSHEMDWGSYQLCEDATSMHLN